MITSTIKELYFENYTNIQVGDFLVNKDNGCRYHITSFYMDNKIWVMATNAVSGLAYGSPIPIQTGSSLSIKEINEMLTPIASWTKNDHPIITHPNRPLKVSDWVQYGNDIYVVSFARRRWMCTLINHQGVLQSLQEMESTPTVPKTVATYWFGDTHKITILETTQEKANAILQNV